MALTLIAKNSTNKYYVVLDVVKGLVDTIDKTTFEQWYREKKIMPNGVKYPQISNTALIENYKALSNGHEAIFHVQDVHTPNRTLVEHDLLFVSKNRVTKVSIKAHELITYIKYRQQEYNLVLRPLNAKLQVSFVANVGRVGKFSAVKGKLKSITVMQ